ncbi:cytochrome c oxidase subunit II [bacterium]|nr:cytochrome c oxidase subunit II [bacterium]
MNGTERHEGRLRVGRRFFRRPTGRFVLFSIAASVLLAACTTDIPQNSLDPASPQARDIDNLWWLVFWIAVVVFVLVEVALVVAIVRFRRRRRGPEREVRQVHGNLRMEIMWTILPVVVLAVIAVPTVKTIFDLREAPTPEENALVVNVIGHQWWWEFEYPELGFSTAQEMYIPAGRSIYLNITSADVIHSFWTPRLHGKRDAVPGRVNNLTYFADEPGDYLGQCAEFCGLAHADMRHMVRAVSAGDFEVWAAKHASLPEIPEEGAVASGWETFNIICVACHVIGDVGPGVDLTVPVADRLPGGSGDYVLAPNLSYFAEREKFGGWTFENDTAHLQAWLADPSDLKPMTPELNDLEEGRVLGMPNFGLSPEDISNLTALLQSLE